jgi:tetratricopeptide (TPR) repeat protein
MWAYVALLAVVSGACAFLPLADHLGYELAEAIALCAGLFGAAPGVAAARAETSRADPDAARAAATAVLAGTVALALPVVLILLNGLRRPACDPAAGLVLYLAVAVPSGVLAAALGLAAGFVAPSRAGWIVAAVFTGSLIVSLWPVARGPQVFAFHHLGGMFPGPIYDEAIRPSRALWIFRGTTLLYAGACAGAALAAGPGRRRAAGLLLIAACGAPAAWLSLHAERFHWKASVAGLDADLGGLLRTDPVVLHFPREKTDDERRLLARDTEVSWRAVREFAGLPLDAAPIDVFLYRGAEEKRRLIGAAETSFTKPWLRQIHTNDAPAPHPILRHELAHAAFAEIAPGPFRVPGGLLPQMALVEGAAVAADWPPGEFTVHEEARALRDLGLLPDLPRLFAPGRFYGESGPRAYAAAGSAIRFLWQSRGPAAFREAYARGVPEVDALASGYAAFLDTIPSQPRAVALAEQRFAAPGIVRRSCPHEVAELERQAQRAADPRVAVQLWSRCVQLEPDDPRLLLQLRRAQLRAGDEAAALETERRAFAHPKLSQPLRAALLVESGDAAWRKGDGAAARERYEQARALAQPEPQERALLARLWAIDDPRRWPALRRLLADGDTGPETLRLLADLEAREPAEGLPPYLLAKQLQNRAEWTGCARRAREALSRKLPGPLFEQEALRMLGLASWHLGDTATARDSFLRLGHNAPPGRSLESTRFLQLSGG